MSITFTKRITTGEYQFEEVTITGVNAIDVKQSAYDLLALKVKAKIDAEIRAESQPATPTEAAGGEGRAKRVPKAKLKEFKDATGEDDDETAKDFIRHADLDVDIAIAAWKEMQAEADEVIDELDDMLDNAVSKDKDPDGGIDDLIGGDEPEELDPVSDADLATFLKAEVKRIGPDAGDKIRKFFGHFKVARATAIQGDADRHEFMAKVRDIKA